MYRIAKQLLAPAVVLCLLAFLASVPIHAQTASGHWVHDPAGIATDGFIYDPPPAGFNPLTATDAEIEQYGLPPRPNASDTARYTHWQKMVTATRIVPELTFTSMYMGSPHDLTNASTAISEQNCSVCTPFTSTDWSGYGPYAASGFPFANNDALIAGQWAIPAVTQGTCSSTGAWMAMWVGLDGLSTTDVLQAGSVEEAVNCQQSTLKTWYEWYPGAVTYVNLSAKTGDSMLVEVWYTTSSPHGHAYLNDQTQQTVSEVGFNPPSGTTYFGLSAEWIVERPSLNGNITNLADFATATFAGFDGAWDGIGGEYYPTSGTGSYSMNYAEINMICPPWNPSSACPVNPTTISMPGAVPPTDYNSFTTYVEGPAN
jgi:hypothetical protein